MLLLCGDSRHKLGIFSVDKRGTRKRAIPPIGRGLVRRQLGSIAGTFRLPRSRMLGQNPAHVRASYESTRRVGVPTQAVRHRQVARDFQGIRVSVAG